MIERTTINGRPATVAYITTSFEPVPKERADMAKVIFDDGDVVFLNMKLRNRAMGNLPRKRVAGIRSAAAQRLGVNSVGLGPPPPARFSPFREIGTGGVAVFGGRPITREKSILVAGPQRWITFADLVSNISIVAAGVRYFLNIISHAQWTVIPADMEKDTDAKTEKAFVNGKPKPNGKANGKLIGQPKPKSKSEAEKVAEFVDSVLNSMETPWRRITRRAAMYRFHGFGVQEWTAKRRDDGKIGLDDIEARPQHTIDRWDVELDGTVRGVWQLSPQTSESLYLPRNKILYMVEDSLTDSPEGLGLFRHLIEPFERLKKYMLLEGQGFERDLRGIPVGRVPYTVLDDLVTAGTMSEERANAIKSSVENFVKLQSRSEDTSIVLDSSPYIVDTDSGKSVSGVMQYGLELLQGQASDFPSLNTAIARVNQEIARVLGVEHLLLGGEGSANRALSEDKSRNFYLTVNGSLDEIADSVDKDIVRVICDLNGIDEELRPKVNHSDVSFRAVSEITAALRDMATAGAVLAPNDPAIDDVRDLLGVARPPELTSEQLALLRPEPSPPASKPGRGNGGDTSQTSLGPDDATDQPTDEDEDKERTEKYDPDQPRYPRGDPRGGQWSDEGGAAATSVSASDLLERSMAMEGRPATRESVFAESHPDAVAAAIQAEAEMAGRSATNGAVEKGGFMKPDGTYTEERQRLHEEIVRRMFTRDAVIRATPAPGEKPVLVLTGGRPAAGKTSTLTNVGMPFEMSRYFYISADEIQESLPGYDGAHAGLFNGEAQDIALQVERLAARMGLNIVYDATMKTTRSALDRINSYRKKGYDVEGYFVHTSPRTSALRSLERFAKTGRYVPVEVALNSKSNEKTFDIAKPLFKRWALYDNNGRQPRLVGSHNIRTFARKRRTTNGQGDRADQNRSAD